MFLCHPLCHHFLSSPILHWQQVLGRLGWAECHFLEPSIAVPPSVSAVGVDWVAPSKQIVRKTCTVWVGCLDELFMCPCRPLSLFIMLHLRSMPLWLEWCSLPCFSHPASLHPSSLSSCLRMLFTSCSVPCAQGGGGCVCARQCVCVCAQACFWVPEAESCCHWELLMVSHWLWAPLLAAL